MSSFWDGLENSFQKTEIPFYAINRALPEDSFFTKPGVARACMRDLHKALEKEKINMNEYVLIEPSAGEGCFIEEFPAGADRIALDINPRSDDIIHADFLTWIPDARVIPAAENGHQTDFLASAPLRNKKYMVIGNPPFGVRGALALAFINRAFLFADVVAFILPMSFYSNGKGSNMKRVKNATLLFNKPLGDASFYRPENGKSVSINTLFQVWKKGAGTPVFADYNVGEYVDIYTCCTSPARFCGLGRGRKYDCFIASTFYKDNVRIVKTFEQVNYGSGYGIIIKKDKRKIYEALETADWTNYCSDATNHCRHIRMFHIRKCLGEQGFGVKK